MITKERLKEIQDIIKTNNLHSMSLNQIAEKNNIEVIFADLSKISDVPLSGSIGNFNGTYRIYIDAKTSIKRQKFTYAHELGHYFLHRDFLTENKVIEDKRDEKYLFRADIYNDVPNDMRRIEEEANEFAGILLMPEKTIRILIDLI